MNASSKSKGSIIMKSATAAEAAIKALPYPNGSTPREDRDAMREAYKAGVDKINREFRDYAEHMHGASHLPQSVRDAIWDKAWEDGHSSGLYNVEIHYEEVADLVLFAIKETR